MVDAAVAAQLQQWTFEKPSLVAHPERSSSDSSVSSSPKLCDDVPDTLRVDDTVTMEDSGPSQRESLVLQDRYLSSEEDLTADDGSDSEYDYDDAVVHDPKECKARTMSISRWDKGKSCDMAVVVSYIAFAGRPKVVELDCRSPIHDRPALHPRSASFASFPINKLRKADQEQRFSMKMPLKSHLASPPLSRSHSPSIDLASRRPSTTHSPVTQLDNRHQANSISTASSTETAPSTRSTSPASSEAPRRPSTSVVDAPASARSSVYIPSRSRLDLTRIQTTPSAYRQSQFAPLTPQSSALSFLSSDPYENSNTNAASPIIKKPAAHKRLRSISMKLALAKIAISPSKKPYDARVNGKASPTPYIPTTPQTAPLDRPSSFTSPNKLRRASTFLRPVSRHGDSYRAPTPEMAPPVPQLHTSTIEQKRPTKMLARGADEREPTLVLPPCPDIPADDPMDSIKQKRLRKRKSLIAFMDSL